MMIWDSVYLIRRSFQCMNWLIIGSLQLEYETLIGLIKLKLIAPNALRLYPLQMMDGWMDGWMRLTEQVAPNFVSVSIPLPFQLGPIFTV
ncbi:hypothetical protein Goari_013644 [Gossypium aridum]|uniref:Uncharacterized protein n=1 Tax=Gossypium aridum TaxID=34290 RepID=A0A7J8XGK7_GOSAI|nr:hypothetical protein [Gossypium aridum]